MWLESTEFTPASGKKFFQILPQYSPDEISLAPFGSPLGDECGIRSLLNCYLREVATPGGHYRVLTLESEFETLPVQTRVLWIQFPSTQAEVVAVVGAASSLIGTWNYVGPSYIKEVGKDEWQLLRTEILAELFSTELSATYQTPKEPDFLIQVRESLRVSNLIFGARTEGACCETPQMAHSRFHPKSHSTFHSTFQATPSFIESEQSLLYGHPFHPSPKGRLGFSKEEVKKYSPEFKSSFQLHYFAVRKEFVLQDSLEDLSAEQLVRMNGWVDFEYDSEFAIIPTHPWQARYLLGLKEVQSEIGRDHLRDLGEMGPYYFATSSVRTLYSPGVPFFFKFSLNVRITNCIRKNTLNEIRNPLQITRLMRRLSEAYRLKYPHFMPLEEPAFLSVDFRNPDPVENQRTTEGFAMILRKSFSGPDRGPDSGGAEQPLLAAALFGNREIGQSWISRLIPSAVSTEEWFKGYVRLLICPFLDLYFEEGILFEAHLQNILISLKDGMPHRVWIRDFENARLIVGSSSEQKMRWMDPSSHQQLLYSEMEGWNRFFYCLMVNHLAEAIYHLSAAWASSQVNSHASSQVEMEKRLWNGLRREIMEYQEQTQNKRAKNELALLLDAQFLPAKENLITRFQRTPDRIAPYVGVPNPLRVLE